MSGALARTLAFALGVVALSHSAFAQDLPALTQPVNDFANVIDPATEATLDALIRRLRDASGDAVVVATVPSMAPYTSIEEYALRLFEKAGIGDKDKANGLLVVLAVGERRVRVEVGYGLEEFITDGFAGETIASRCSRRFGRADTVRGCRPARRASCRALSRGGALPSRVCRRRTPHQGLGRPSGSETWPSPCSCS